MRVTAQTRVQGARRSVVLAAALAAFVALLAAALATTGARAAVNERPYNAASGTVYAGVSDTGDLADYSRFTSQVGKHLPILQSWHTWGYDQLGVMLDRWEQAKVRGMLHIQTRNNDGYEVITPRGVARGKGDGFLMRLAFEIGDSNQVVYLRPFGEMNNWRNAYCAYDRYGRSKGYQYYPHAFRNAWKRIAIVTRGGPISTINKKLTDKGMPPLQKDFGTDGLPYTKTAMVWTPMTAGSPNTSANGPGTYWGGTKYIDWVGTDLYSKFPNFTGLNRFYNKYNDHPFALTEWGAWGSDDANFIQRVFTWAKYHTRARQLIYYQGWDSTFSIGNKPRVRDALRVGLHGKRFVPYPPEYSGSSTGGVPAG